MTERKRRARGAETPAREEALRQAAAGWGLPDLDMGLLRQVLVHSSAVPAHSTDSNERLEFLGDSIVNASVADYLYHTYPQWAEGDLAKGRSLVVSKLSLYEVGVRLGLPDLIQVGSNTEGALARSRRSLSEDSVEALVAAVYLQFGWERARAFVLEILAPELAAVAERKDLRDAKTILQERAQSRREPPPAYRIVAEHGDPHNRTYTAEVVVHDDIVATGSGRSKKDAQQAAAAAALEQIED